MLLFCQRNRSENHLSFVWVEWAQVTFCWGLINLHELLVSVGLMFKWITLISLVSQCHLKNVPLFTKHAFSVTNFLHWVLLDCFEVNSIILRTFCPFFNIKLFTCVIISLKICFFIYFPAKRKQQSQQSSLDPPTTVTGVSNLVFKFDLTLDILEEDNKGFSSAARDKNCFKLRQDLRKKVFITVQQLTNRHLIVERFVTIPVAEKRRMIMSLMITLSYLVWSVTMVLLRTLID